MARCTIISVLVALSVACATASGMQEAVLNRAAFDLNCDRAKLQAVVLNSTLGSREVGVTGCEKRAVYIVGGDGVNGYTAVLNSDTSNK